MDSSGAGNARAEDEDLCEQPFNEAPQFGPKATQAKKRIFVTLDKGLSYFISLVYTEHGLALGTAFPPDGEWLRKMQANSMRISP